MSAYAEASKAVYRVFEDTTPLVEGLSIDEAFLDVRGLRRISGTPIEIAARLRRDVHDRVGLPITVGIARTKFLAKVASGVAKPDGLLLVPPDAEFAFLHPLPVERLWGVGAVTASKLRSWGVMTVGEVAHLPEATLVAMLGRASGRHIHALAHNRDPRPVQARRRRRSIGAQRALGSRPRSPEEIDAVLLGLVDRVTRRMRAAGRVGRTVVLRLRFERLLPGDPFPLAPVGDRSDRDDPCRGQGPRYGCWSSDRAAGPHARRRGGREPRERRRRPARPALRPERRRTRRHARRDTSPVRAVSRDAGGAPRPRPRADGAAPA